MWLLFSQKLSVWSQDRIKECVEEESLENSRIRGVGQQTALSWLRCTSSTTKGWHCCILFMFVISVHVFQYPVSYHQLRFTSFNRKIIFLVVLVLLPSPFIQFEEAIEFSWPHCSSHVLNHDSASLCTKTHTYHNIELSVFQWWVRLLLEQEALSRNCIYRTSFSLESEEFRNILSRIYESLLKCRHPWDWNWLVFNSV